MKKVLLTTPVGPYESHYYNQSLTDVMDQRFSRGCGIFTLRGHVHINFAHVLAQNIEAPTVFLEYPRWEDFEEELARNYSVVGINGFHNQRDVVIKMARRVRALAPNSRILLGGWAGTAVKSIFPESEWKEYADDICVGDGISFMRKELGEEVSAPISISHLPKWGSELPWLQEHPKGDSGTVVASLGCPKACDFCGTTHMFKFKRNRLLTADQTFAEFKRYYMEEPRTRYINLIEEDTFADAEFVNRISELFQAEDDYGLDTMGFFCLASNESLSKWTFDEIVKSGVCNIFLGVESMFAVEGGYKKRRGRAIEETFRELHRRGIMTIGAWIGGFDFQNRNNIDEDLQSFIALEPTFQQLARLCPFPGTRLWEKLRDEGVIDPLTIPAESISFFGGGGMTPKNFHEHEMMEIIDRGYVKLYETWGSNLLRYFKVILNGYEYCRHHSDPLVRLRADFHLKRAVEAYPLFLAQEIYAPNSTVRKRVSTERARYAQLVGEPTRVQRVLEKAVLKAAKKAMKNERDNPLNSYPKEEPYKRYDYHRNSRKGKCPYTTTHPRREFTYRIRSLKRDIENRIVYSFLKIPAEKLSNSDQGKRLLNGSGDKRIESTEENSSALPNDVPNGSEDEILYQLPSGKSAKRSKEPEETEVV